MATRLRRSKDKEQIYQQLVRGEDAPFMLLKDVFLMAACIGYKYARREPIAPGGEQIPWSVFNDDADHAIVNAIALAETSELHVLLSTEDQMERKFNILEEYANGGIAILEQKVMNAPGNLLDNLIGLIFEEEIDDRSSPRGVLNKIAEDLF
ncbi:MAG: DNA phosphorothioation-associated protein 4 [Carboxydocellales bacterium]